MFPTNKGAIQGGAISPTIANMTLDGLEVLIHRRTNPGKKVEALVHREHKINFVRFADDFIVTGESKEILEEVKEIIKEFLEERGLELSEEKTIITNIKEGFDFLGWNFKKYEGKLIIKPSEKSVKSESIRNGPVENNYLMRRNSEMSNFDEYSIFGGKTENAGWF